MKTKKQKEVTVAQVKIAKNKLLVLENKRQRIVTLAIPLRATLKKFIEQNGLALERFSHTTHPGSDTIKHALSKIKRGYFYDLTLSHLHMLAHTLLSVRWEDA